MSISSLELQDIDILSDSLSFFGEDYASQLQDDGLVRYGDVVLNIPAKASIYSMLVIPRIPCYFVISCTYNRAFFSP